MPRTRTALLFLLAVVTATPLSGQSVRPAVIRGTVLTVSADAAVRSASLQLRAQGDTTLLARTAPDAAGRFRFTAVPAGRYVVAATLPGYARVAREAVVAAGDTLDLGEIRLEADVIVLDSMNVVAEAAPVVFAADRDIYDAATLSGSAGGVASDLLASIPGLEVDIDGAVSLRGGRPRIHINGRPAPMDGAALDAFLQQYPADAIERIEVIPDPSARYDADGAGIVNIVLKAGASLGTSGSLFANAHTRGEAGVGGRATWQRGDLVLSGNTFLRRTDRETESFDLRQNLVTDPTTYLRQDAFSERSGLSGSADIVAELRLTAKSMLRARAVFADFGTDSDGRTTTTHLDSGEVRTQRYDRLSRTESGRVSANGALRFTHAFAERDHELEIDFSFEDGRDGSDRRVETRFDLVADDALPVPADLTLEDRHENDRQVNLDVDYARPLGERTALEVGYRSRTVRREDDRLLRQFDDADPMIATETTERGFDRRETVNALYVTLERSIGRLGVQAGMRAEHTASRYADHAGPSWDADWLNLYPGVNANLRIGQRDRLRFAYSRRTRRPSPQSLSPIDRSTDPLNRRIGNPDLEPQYTHSFSLDASRSASWGSLRLSPWYRRVTNDWADIRTVDGAGVATTMPMNVASQDMYGATLTASLRRRGGWSGLVSLTGQGERRDASNLSARYNGHSFRWSVRTNLSGRLGRSLTVRSTASYTPARDVPQGRISSRIDSSVSLRQPVLGGRASLSLTVRDPFELGGTSFESRDPTFIQIGRSDVSRRSASLSFNWSFGGGGVGRR